MQPITARALVQRCTHCGHQAIVLRRTCCAANMPERRKGMWMKPPALPPLCSSACGGWVGGRVEEEGGWEQKVGSSRRGCGANAPDSSPNAGATAVSKECKANTKHTSEQATHPDTKQEGQSAHVVPPQHLLPVNVQRRLAFCRRRRGLAVVCRRQPLPNRFLWRQVSDLLHPDEVLLRAAEGRPRDLPDRGCWLHVGGRRARDERGARRLALRRLRRRLRLERGGPRMRALCEVCKVDRQTAVDLRVGRVLVRVGRLRGKAAVWRRAVAGGGAGGAGGGAACCSAAAVAPQRRYAGGRAAARPGCCDGCQGPQSQGGGAGGGPIVRVAAHRRRRRHPPRSSPSESACCSPAVSIALLPLAAAPPSARRPGRPAQSGAAISRPPERAPAPQALLMARCASMPAQAKVPSAAHRVLKPAERRCWGKGRAPKLQGLVDA